METINNISWPYIMNWVQTTVGAKTNSPSITVSVLFIVTRVMGDFPDVYQYSFEVHATRKVVISTARLNSFMGSVAKLISEVEALPQL